MSIVGVAGAIVMLEAPGDLSGVNTGWRAQGPSQRVACGHGKELGSRIGLNRGLGLLRFRLGLGLG